MYNVSSSNLIPLCVLRVLEEHSDEYHHLTQEEISRFLDLEYNMPVERKAIGRSVEHLRQQLELEIISERDGVWLASRTFEDSELRLLIDAVMSSRYIKPNYTKDLINKLCRLSGKHFSSNVNNLYSINESVKSDNAELFNNISVIDEAISRNKKIKFQYCEYGIDKKLHAHSPHTLSPYRMLLHEGIYYVIGWDDDEYNYGLHSFKIDHLKDMELLEERARQFDDEDKNLDEKEYFRQVLADPVMGLEKPTKFIFYAKNYLVDDIIEYFGKEIKIKEADEVPEWMLGFDNSVIVEAKVSYYAMKRFALEHIDSVQVVEPAELEADMRAALIDARRRYDIPAFNFPVTEQDLDAVDDLPLHTKAAFGLPIFFGAYPFAADGRESMIEWMPLRFEEDRVLLITKHCIDAVIFDDKDDNITWRDSNLRKWMNETFYETAFIDEEKSQILLSTLKNPDDEYTQEEFMPVSPFRVKEHIPQEEYETRDKVFALSVMEAARYFPSVEERMAFSTDYLKAKCSKMGWNRQNSWWLRTPSEWHNKAAAVYSFGAITTHGEFVYNETVAVRPAIWVRR